MSAVEISRLHHLDPYGSVLVWLRANTALDPAAELAAERLAARSGEPPPIILNRMGAVGDADLQKAFATVSGLPLAGNALEPTSFADVSPHFLRAKRAIIFGVVEDALAVGVVDPFDAEIPEGIAFATGREVQLFIVRADEQRRVSEALYDAGDSRWMSEVADRDAKRVESALEYDRDAPVARRVAAWLADAVNRRASDVHFEPRSQAFVVRYRIDGRLQTVLEEPLAAASPVISRVKLLADLDLGERRAAQDGRTTIVVSGRPVDLRVSIVPSVHGESAVIRILDRREVRLDWDALGFDGEHQELLRRMCNKPNGLFLVTGPTGSGKTTTLYSCLQSMRDSQRKVLAIEDPVEFYFDHVTQVQTAPKAGVSFSSAIRAFLRQDPDVILVGEIRDGETARTAVQAALTGHLVLATLHAIDAARAPARLLDMGVDAFQLDACLSGVLAQRLVRKLCPACRRERQPTRHEQRTLGLGENEMVFEPGGCGACGRSGFHGRLVIAEANTEYTGTGGSSAEDAGNIANAGPPSGLVADGVRKIRAGLTSPGELIAAMAG